MIDRSIFDDWRWKNELKDATSKEIQGEVIEEEIAIEDGYTCQVYWLQTTAGKPFVAKYPRITLAMDALPPFQDNSVADDTSGSACRRCRQVVTAQRFKNTPRV